MTGGLSGPESFQPSRTFVPSGWTPRLSLTGALPDTLVVTTSCHSGGELSSEEPPPQPALAAVRTTSANTAAASGDESGHSAHRMPPQAVTTVKLLVTGVPALSIAHTGQIVVSESVSACSTRAGSTSPWTR